MKVFTMKFCINCKHFSPKPGDDPQHLFARCSRNHSPSLVTGTLVREDMRYCNALRMSECGAEGKHYEEKNAPYDLSAPYHHIARSAFMEDNNV